ncbi:HEAT repeat domain-containing protein [Reichenbachiella agarivorans]|uniref:HEAT repeat domain-containing protein n=1 Tax=Reichenbachiella agarivorans TaxID=2979464 RepID=A0ABY6CMB5_9BACT|nr:HEAT repeat domain-containing protein [Reichenbachiella agarivorans]UXP31519.1 HEAT repeat domain-containing protein [Reichenbachiella agarivorans]
MDIHAMVAKISGELSDKAYEVSDSLARIGSEEVLQAMIVLLKNPNPESRYLAARTMAHMTNNAAGLAPLMDAIQDKENSSQQGELLAELEGFDVSDYYVELFKYYLFGGFKVSMIAKDLLDHKDFDITARVIKKATKHWNHYTNNVKHDELFTLKKREVEEILADLQAFVSDES